VTAELQLQAFRAGADLPDLSYLDLNRFAGDSRSTDPTELDDFIAGGSFLQVLDSTRYLTSHHILMCFELRSKSLLTKDSGASYEHAQEKSDDGGCGQCVAGRHVRHTGRGG
jgi:hypothetical protein